MARDNKSTKPQNQTEPEDRSYLMNPDQFDNLEGQEFGGESRLLSIEVGEAAGPFSYAGHQEITTDLGTTTSHQALDQEGDMIRLPISATFLKALDQARVQYGDVFAIKRDEDVTKKKGKGAGQPMAIYRIKLIKRATVQS